VKNSLLSELQGKNLLIITNHHSLILRFLKWSWVNRVLSGILVWNNEKREDNNLGKSMKSSDSNLERLGKHLVYFAAERTLMSWITTSLGLMALGFVIDRFGLILQQILSGGSPSMQPSFFSFWAGAALVSAGALMAMVGAVRYLRFAIRCHHAGDADPGYGLVPAIFFTVLVAVAGAIIVAFLLEELG